LPSRPIYAFIPLMTAPPATATPTNSADPPQDRPPAAADGPKTTGFLLGLVRKLIDYGKQLAAAVRQHPPATILPCVPRFAGTIDVGQLLARIACGLQRAAALEARLLRRARQEEKPAPASPPPPRRPSAAPPAARRAADPDPARLPTAAEIASQVRHRPVGAVIADICRDFGIMPDHPLWRELQQAVVANGSNLAVVLKSIIERPMVCITDHLTIALHERPPKLQSAAAFATGPP